MMMTRFVLTLLVGLVVSLGALVSGGPVLAKNWNTKQENNEKVRANQNKDELNVFDLPTCKENVLTFLFGRHAAQSEPCFINYTYPFGPAGGDTFVGEVRNGSWHNGTYTFGPKSEHAGHKYFGEIKNGKWHGKGVYTYPNGFKESGLWREGVFQGVDTSTVVSNSIPKKEQNVLADLSDAVVCRAATFKKGKVQWKKSTNGLFPAKPFVSEAKRRGLSCGVGETTQITSAPVPKAEPKVTPAALTAAEKEAERLRQELTALKAQQQQRQQTISNDTQVPLITITQSGVDGRKGSVKGYAKDNVQVAEVLIDGQAIRVGNDGSFEWLGFVPATGKEITIEAIDTAALSSTQVISLKRGQIQQASGPRFDVLDPTAGKKVKRNDNALALIVGISDYKRTDAPAVYADKDAQYFHDYASLKLGISDSNIKTMVNAKAEQGDVILAVKDWMRRSSKPGKTDVYVFFAGHGLASDDGEQMYLLPYDGRPRLLDKTAILREELFDDIASANPRSVTVFLDTCYSGTTRGTDMLIASRPIAIKALEQSIPENFTVMTAARGDQTAKPLEEAKHGMFSYFLMKGMEGEADKNQDNKITAGELHQYVQSNVVQQSSGSQTPELQGDAERVLVRFQ